MSRVTLCAGATLVSLTAAQPVAAQAVGPDAILDTLSQIEATLKESSYTHATRVDVKAGRYEFDCSGMAAWVLQRSSPKAHAAVVYRAKSGRPLARDYYETIAKTRPDKPRYGWSRVSRVADAAPGDVIAWLRPKEIRSANTGHVAFIVSAPEPVAAVPHAYLLRIADASRYQHDRDSRTDSERTGFGQGTILVVADPESGAPVAYG